LLECINQFDEMHVCSLEKRWKDEDEIFWINDSSIFIPEYWMPLPIQPERSKREDPNNGFFPPPWNPNEHPEKTEGWLEFQREMKKYPKYYLGCGALNTMET
jgi:hypothetical protein